MAENARDEIQRYIGDLEDRTSNIKKLIDKFTEHQSDIEHYSSSVDELISGEFSSSLEVPPVVDKQLQDLINEHGDLLLAIDTESDSEHSEMTWGVLDAVNDYLSHYDDIEADLETLNAGLKEVVSNIEDVLHAWNRKDVQKLDKLSDQLTDAITGLKRLLK